MDKELIYLGHDNSIDIILKSNDTAVDLSGMTVMSLTFGTLSIDSTNNATHAITWNKSGYATGEVRIRLGETTKLHDRYYDAVLTVYDAASTNGIIWGAIPIKVIPDPEGTT